MIDWQPIETIPQGKDAAGKGFLIAAFDPADTYDDGTLGPAYIEWGNGPHRTSAGEVKWINFNSNNYAAWKPPPTHWAPLPGAPPIPTKESDK